MTTLFDLEGRTAFITGGTSGIGLVTARRFAAAGARVAIVGRRDAGDLAAAMNALFIRCDVADEAALAGAFAQAEDRLGPLDVVMNNAGIENTGPLIEDADAAQFQRLIDVNVKPVYNGLRYGARHLRDGGCIINTASVAALIGVPGYAQYSATKAAVVSLTRNAAMELAPRRIRVNAICPGSIWSEMLTAEHPEVALIEKLAPMGRVGEPEEVAGVAHFLATAEAGYVTGQALCVDGGVSAGFAMHTIEAVLGG